MHEYFAISVHFVVFILFLTKNLGILLLLVEKSYAYLITSEK